MITIELICIKYYSGISLSTGSVSCALDEILFLISYSLSIKYKEREWFPPILEKYPARQFPEPTTSHP